MTPVVSVRDVTEAVHESGVAVVPHFATGNLLMSLRRRANELLRSNHALRFPKSTRVWDLYRHGQPFIDLLTNSHLGEFVADLLGEHYLLSDYSLNSVNPHQPQDDWHLDYPFNEMTTLTQDALLGLQCVLALDEFTAENGATQFVPGSHRPARRPDPSGGCELMSLEVPVGSLLIMAAATWHRSGYNSSSQPRTGILLSFVERWIRPMSGPPEPGPWSGTRALRLQLGMERPPESINGVPIDGQGQ